MERTILLKRGRSELRETFTPAAGELILEIDTNRLFVGDGETPGGHLITGDHLPTLAEKLKDGDLKLQMQDFNQKFILDDHEDLL